jgi:hypothetical protein
VKRRKRSPLRLSEEEIAEVAAVLERHRQTAKKKPQGLETLRDEGLQFILANGFSKRSLSGRHFGWGDSDDVAIKLLKSDVPLSQDNRRIIAGILSSRDPKRRKHNDDDALAHAIADSVGFVAAVLHRAGYGDPITRATEFVADHWHKQEPKGRSRFNSGQTLTMWLRRHGLTNLGAKMLNHLEPSEPFDEG